DYSAFEKAARKVNISGYTLLNCTNDEGSYMAMFYKTDEEAFGIYGYPAQMFSAMSSGAEGAKVIKTTTVNGHKAVILEMEEDESTVAKLWLLFTPNMVLP
ncbi:MAG: hypothetical protein HC830_08380, partial [Bacteroidetes bacterium]|nr:hypothetical protein [Bacteroidota bacterium]